MTAPSSLVGLRFVDQVAHTWLFGGGVKMAHRALGDHGLDGAVERSLQSADEIHLESVGILDDFRINCDCCQHWFTRFGLDASKEDEATGSNVRRT